MFEQPPTPTQNQDQKQARVYDLTDSQDVCEILEKHDLENMRKLAEKTGINLETVELASMFSQLRKKILEREEILLEERKKNGAVFTDDEILLGKNLDLLREQQTPELTASQPTEGVYLEALEPQVRSAVLSLMKKGYQTYESGFVMGAEQMIGFSQNYFSSPEKIRI